jgi:hypothetical protein
MMPASRNTAFAVSDDPDELPAAELAVHIPSLLRLTSTAALIAFSRTIMHLGRRSPGQPFDARSRFGRLAAACHQKPAT